MQRILVLGDSRVRARLTERIEAAVDAEVTECDPALGDCVMYVRLEGCRYDGFVFAGYDDPVSRGALAAVAEHAVLLPLLERDGPAPDAAHDGYLFRLPQALGFRDEAERAALLAAVAKARTVPSVLIGAGTPDRQALADLIAYATNPAWSWDSFVEGVRREVERRR